MKHDLKSRRLLCDALNKLFWKCRMPTCFLGQATLDEWANFWIAEIRSGPDDKCITGIKWSVEHCLFVPCRERRG